MAEGISLAADQRYWRPFINDFFTSTRNVSYRAMKSAVFVTPPLSQ